MERKKCKLILMILLLASVPAFADNGTQVYNAYVKNKMDLWKEVIDKMQAEFPVTNPSILELINYQYGYIGYCLGFNKEAEARTYLTLAEKNIETLEKKNFRPDLTEAYRAAFYGFRISLNKLTAPVNGPKSINHAKRSVEMNSENYFSLIQLGNIYFYMPQAFGGSKKTALDYYNKARALMEKERSLITENWNYLSLLVTLGQAYTYIEDYEKAEDIYEFILRTEPGFLYVKNELFPALATLKK